VKFEHSIVIEAERDRVHAFLHDVPVVAKCLPGLEQIAHVGEDVYEGRVRIKIGPLGLNISGRAKVQRPQAGEDWRVDGEGRDGRAGAGVKASLSARLDPLTSTRTGVDIAAELQFSGRLAELGQPLIRRKANAMVEEFGQNLRRALEG
jgi:uncharacterized protein